MPPGNFCRAGGWHLRSELCVELFLHLLSFLWHLRISAVSVSVAWIPRCLVTIFTRRVRERLEQLFVAFTWLNGSLCAHAISFCTILMTEWICWYKPFWIRRGESYQKGYLEEWEKWTSRKTMPPEKTSRARPLQSRRLKEYRRPKSTNVPLHANRIVAVVLCLSHRGKRLVRLTHHHGSTQVPKKTQYHGDLLELSHNRMLALAILSIQSNSALSPEDWPCRTPMKRSYLVMRKMSRPHGMVFRLG